MCARCAARGSVDWEERGDQFWGRALFLTFREALLSPRSLGLRLSGAGRVGLAALYNVSCGLLGCVPLAVLAAALTMPVADALTLGIRSTSLLSNAVLMVLFAVGTASLLPLALGLWSLLLLALARCLRVTVSFAVLFRASAYGVSLLAVPLLGPLLLPLALLLMLVCLYGALSTAAGSARAAACLLLALALLTAPFLLTALR
jgi:hypothetical protein